MKKKLYILFLIFFMFPFNIKAFSSSAESTILMDMDSGRIIYSHNMNHISSVASISKIMTAYVALMNASLDSIVIVGDEINKAYGSAIYLKVGESISLRDLLYGLMLRSGNDAALAIAKYVGGSVPEFVNMMNDTAKKIGMKNTTFKNPSGLDEEDGGNLSTAYDMAILTSEAMKMDEYKKIVSTKKHSVKTDMNYYIWHNKNKMLSLYPYSTGGKTGYTEIAHRTLVSTASRDNLNLVAVTLNDGNDWLDHKNLFTEAFRLYKSYKILASGDVDILGESYYLNYGFYLKNDFYYPLRSIETDSILIKFNLEKKDDYKDGDLVGKALVFLGEEKIHEEDIFLKKVIHKKNFIEKFKDWFNHLW